MHDDFWLEEKQQGHFSAFGDIMRGETGPHYTPAVDENGNLSWTNNGNLPNPEKVNIKGPSGKSAYQQAVEGGYRGTEAEFNAILTSFPEKAETAENAAERAAASAERAAALVDTLPEDYEDLLQDTAKTMQSIESTTLGPAPIVTFDASAADMPLKGLTVDIEPVQEGSGDPSPENVRPISGWTGCNIVHGGIGDISFTPNKAIDGSGNIVSSSGAGYSELIGVSTADDAVVINNISVGQKRIRVHAYDASGGWLRQVATINILASDPVGFYKNPVLLADTDKFLRISTGNRTTAKLVTVGHQTAITFPTSAGTVYGGTLDVVNKKLTVDRGFKTIDENTAITKDNSGFYTQDNSVFRLLNYSDAIICDRLNTVSDHIALRALNIGITAYAHESALLGQNWIYFKNGDQTITNVEQMKTWLSSNPLHVVYLLSNPVVYDLTDIPEITTLLGTNNIWADTDDVTVSYGAYLETIKSHAERLGDSILSAIAPLEATYTASRAYAVGTYLFVGTTFYKVTAAIAEGGTITPETNVTQTTVAEQLANLARYALQIVITEHPQNVTSPVGNLVKFEVRASGTNLSYQWQFSADSGNTWNNWGDNSSTFSFTMEARFSGRKYRCIVKNGDGKQLTSDVATLTLATE